MTTNLKLLPQRQWLPALTATLLMLFASLHAQQVAPSSAAAEVPIQLSVFEVAAGKDDSYGADTSTSITGTRKDLRRTPVSVEIMSRALLNDLGAMELREILEFAPGVGAFQIAGGSSDIQGNQPGDRIGAAVGTIRGLGTGMSRNGLLPNVSSFDQFSKDRVEIIRGPQALLYGATNASGIIVVDTKRASLARNSVRLTHRTDSERSQRGEFEINAVSPVQGTSQKVAVLATVFRADDKFWRVNNEIESHGFYLAGTWRISSRLTIRSDFERVHRHAIDPTTIRLTSPANDPTYGSRNNIQLRTLLYQGRASDLFGGKLNYSNADSFGTDVFGEVRDSDILQTQAEIQVTKGLSLLVQGGYANDARIRYNSAVTPNLVPPGLSGNPTGDWAVQLSPSIDPIRMENKSWRALANLTLPELRFVKSDLAIGGQHTYFNQIQPTERWYQIDANGNFVVNAAQANNASSGRTAIGNLWWAPGSQGWDGPVIFRSVPANTLVLNGVSFRRDIARRLGAVPATADNPFGVANGSAGLNYNRRNNDAGFAALNSDWFGGRLDTMFGYRYDVLENIPTLRPFEARTFRQGTSMLGANWHLSRQLTAYVAHSTSFQPSAGVTPANVPVPPGTGVGDEAGLKFGLFSDKLTGAVSFYSTQAKSNSANLPTDVWDIVDHFSNVNGKRNSPTVYCQTPPWCAHPDPTMARMR